MTLALPSVVAKFSFKIRNQRTFIKFYQESLRVFDSSLEPEAALLSWSHLGRGDPCHTAHFKDSEGRGQGPSWESTD